MKSIRLGSAVASILLVTMLPAWCQELTTSLFKEAEDALARARDVQAHILSPNNYTQAMEEYQKAAMEYKKEGSVEDIRKSFDKLNGYLHTAFNNVDIAHATFPQVINARIDAIEANALANQKSLWDDAEAKLNDAAKRLEKGDLKNAKEESAKAEKLYRQAELESIKTTYLVNARMLIEKADDQKVDKSAPQTLKKATDLLQRAEKELNENRYDFDEARSLAQTAEYEAQHALYLAGKIEELDKLDISLENIILANEAALSELGSAAGLPLKFDQGIGVPISDLSAYITQLQDSLARTTEYYRIANTKIYHLERLNMEQKNLLELQLQEQSEALQKQIEAAAERQRTMEATIKRQNEINSKFTLVEKMFDSNEAQVFRQGNNVIIRLHGLNFPVGQSTIQSEYFPLLTKLKEAILTFDNSQVVIQGHTDSHGGDQLNQELSEARASGILEYLSNNMTILKDQFTAIGYGESQPLASNESKEGRAKNRRIDVVIKPQL